MRDVAQAFEPRRKMGWVDEKCQDEGAPARARLRVRLPASRLAERAEGRAPSMHQTADSTEHRPSCCLPQKSVPLLILALSHPPSPRPQHRPSIAITILRALHELRAIAGLALLTRLVSAASVYRLHPGVNFCDHTRTSWTYHSIHPDHMP